MIILGSDIGLSSDIVILDNLAVRKSAKAATVLKQKGAWVQFLPPPIEVSSSKLKAHLRKVGAGTFDALQRAVGGICDLFIPRKCWIYLKEAE